MHSLSDCRQGPRLYSQLAIYPTRHGISGPSFMGEYRSSSSEYMYKVSAADRHQRARLTFIVCARRESTLHALIPMPQALLAERP